MARKFYAAHSNYGKCSIESMNYTAWDYIKSFDSKASRTEWIVNKNNWFEISADEYRKMAKIKMDYNRGEGIV